MLIYCSLKYHQKFYTHELTVFLKTMKSYLFVSVENNDPFHKVKVPLLRDVIIINIIIQYLL